EQSIKPDTPTAALAKEQAELAHALRESASGRGQRFKSLDKAGALKALNAIGEKLTGRKAELDKTRAPEIISLAERRFQSVLSGPAKARQATAAREEASARQQRGSGTALDPKSRQVAKTGSPDDRGDDGKLAPSAKPGPQTEPTPAGDSNPQGNTGRLS